MPEIEDIVETTEKAPLLLPWQWALLGIAFVIAIIIIRKLLQRRATPASAADPLEPALKQLHTIRNQSLNDTELSTEISLLVRQFLQQKFDLKTLFQTPQEFLADHKDLNRLPERARTNLSKYLTTLAEHKYAPHRQLPSHQDELINHTESLLRALNTIPPQTDPETPSQQP